MLGLAELAPDRPLELRINRADGSSDTVSLNHTYTEQQIEWFRAGSALNMISGRV